MKLINGSKYAALEARLQRTARELEAAERLATISRLRTELEQVRDIHPDSPLPHPPAAPGDVELRRQLNLALRTVREQGARLDELQTSHVADTRELHDLRQGVAS